MPLAPFFSYDGPMEQFTDRQKKDLKILIDFIRTYCASRHQEQADVALPAELSEAFRRGITLCPDCQGLLDHAIMKRRKCPLDPKPSCKNCHVHCYSKDYRTKIREIMAFSGRRMIMRGRLDYLWHYFF
jgi:hypothetical protein